MREKEYRHAVRARGGLLYMQGVPEVAFGDRVSILAGMALIAEKQKGDIETAIVRQYV